MPKKLVFALLAFLTFCVGEQASAQETQTIWAHPGADPYASSPGEAIRRLPEALPALAPNIPEPARVMLVERVNANPQGDDITFITPDMQLEAMMYSPGGDVKRNVSLKDIPIKFEDKNGMYLSARAREWRVEYEGQTYVLLLPDICNNWAWRSLAIERPREVIREVIRTPDCVELHVPKVHAGDRMTLEIRADSSTLPPSECWAYQVAGAWKKWPDCLTCFTADGPMVFRLPLEVAEKYEITICWSHGIQKSHKGVISPNMWVNRRFVVDFDLETGPAIPKGGS